MPQVPFVEYVRPTGLRRDIHIDRPQPIYDRAAAIRKAGLELAIEKIPYGDVSLTIADTFEEEDLAIRICENNEDAIARAVDALITDFPLETYNTRFGEVPLLDPEDF